MKINNMTLTKLKTYMYFDGIDLRWSFSDQAKTKGEIVGGDGERYRFVIINKTQYKAHRIIYQFYNNVEFLGDSIIDHIDGDTFNNNPLNLRICNQSQNSRNRKKPKTNTTGYKGVTKTKSGNYRVRVTTDNGRITIGYFSDIEVAAQAYTQAATLFHGVFFKKPN